VYDRDADLARLVDALERAPSFTQHAARRLLVTRVERYLDGRLFVPDHDIPRNWFLHLVEELDERPGGLATLARAVAFIARNSRLADTVSALVVRLTALPAPAIGGGVAVGLPGSAPPRLPASSPSLAGPRPAVGPQPAVGPRPSAGPPDLTATELAELARLFAEPSDAIRLLVAAGLPRARVPTWGAVDADRYWYSIAEQLRAGVLSDARLRVLDAALRMYPGNAVFLAASTNLGESE